MNQLAHATAGGGIETGAAASGEIQDISYSGTSPRGIYEVAPVMAAQGEVNVDDTELKLFCILF